MSKDKGSLTSASETNDIDQNARDVSCIRAEINSVRVPVPAIPAWIVEIRNAIMTPSNEVIFRDLVSMLAFFRQREYI